MTERWTYSDVFHKCDHEGGLEEGLTWGITSKDVPLALEGKWRRLQACWAVYQAQADEVYALLEAGMEDEKDDE